MATTIREVAAAANVSIATASRALSGSDIVIESTRRRVIEAAAELRYTPSRLARSLATGLTGNIGVVLPDVTNPFYTTFLAAVESAAAARDFGILIGDSREDPEIEHGLVRRMSSQVDALVLASSRLPDDEIVAASARLPVVLANRRLDERTPVPGTLSQVIIDVDPGFGAAVRHLHSLGHRAIIYVDGPPNSWSAGRKHSALARECALVDVELIVLDADGSPDFTAGRRAAARLVGLSATAVITFNDQMALGLLSALRESGTRVPDQLSVIGCDDSLPEGLAWPALTTIDSSSHTLGTLAVNAVLDPTVRRDGTVPTRLVIRGSTSSRAAELIHTSDAIPISVPIHRSTVQKEHYVNR